MKTHYTARYTHFFTEERVYGTKIGRESTKQVTETTLFALRLGKMTSSQQDVTATEQFLREFVAQKPRVGSFDTDVAKPVLTQSELRLMGISEQRRHVVYFPSVERVTFSLAAPVDQWEATKMLISLLAAKLPQDATTAVRNLMASAYLTAWKRRPGNWMKTQPAFLEQTGLADFHVPCIVSFDTTVTQPFADLDNLPPEGSVQRRVIS